MTIPRILKTDPGGIPVGWIHWQDAACYYVKGHVLWEVGDEPIVLRGGRSSNGDLHTLDVAPIIAVPERGAAGLFKVTPPLTRRELYHRDGGLCLYCNTRIKLVEMEFEHVVPRCQGGQDRWDNIVSACHHCNHIKGSRTPEQAGMPLLALPYVPNRAEWLILANRHILADQQAFLEAMAPAQRRSAAN